jgi:hypothetical protein
VRCVPSSSEALILQKGAVRLTGSAAAVCHPNALSARMDGAELALTETGDGGGRYLLITLGTNNLAIR